MGKCTVAGGNPGMKVPVTGIQLGTIAEGQIVKINESGTPVDFYVAKHNYEPDLNGTGRTLLVRKAQTSARQWHHSAMVDYASSDIDAWLNGPYKERFDATTQAVIGETKFKYWVPDGQSGQGTLSNLARSVFVLAGSEMCYIPNPEGKPLPTYDILASIGCWSRSPSNSDTQNVYYVKDYRNVGPSSCTANRPSLPCFTLPSTAVFDETTLILKGGS